MRGEPGGASASSANDGSSGSSSGIASRACARASSGAADRCVLLGELLVEPAVGRVLALPPRRRPARGAGSPRRRRPSARSVLPTAYRAISIAGALLGLALARPQRALERIERELEVAGFVVLPAEVVEERPEPVRGVVVQLGELDPSLRPVDEAVAVALRRARPCARRRRRRSAARASSAQREGGLEERTRRLRIAARAAQAAALEIDRVRDRGLSPPRLVASSRSVARLEVAAEPAHARELRHDLCAAGVGLLRVELRPETPLRGVEIVEVPERSQRSSTR